MQQHAYNASAMPPPHGVHVYSELEHIFMASSLIVIITGALIGNIMVCIIIYRKRRLRTRTNYYIINLAVADLGVVFLCMPFSLVTCLFHDWMLGDVICNVNGFFNIVFTQSSLLTLIAIGIDKYYAIVWPLRKLMTKRRTVGLLCWTWLQPIAIAVVPFSGFTNFEFKAGSTQCGVAYPHTVEQTIYGVVVAVLGYLIPLVIIAYAYVKIFHSSFRSARRMSRVSITSRTSTNFNSIMSHKRVALTVMILVLVFFSCWTPYFVYVTIVIVNNDLSTNQRVLNLGKAAYWTAFLCSALNPFIYGWRNPKIKKEFNLLMCCLCPCITSRLRSPSGSKGSWDSSGQNGYSPTYRRVSTPFASPGPTPRNHASDIALFLEKLSKSQKNYLNSMYKDTSEEENEDSLEKSDKSDIEMQQLRFADETEVGQSSNVAELRKSSTQDMNMYRGSEEAEQEEQKEEISPPVATQESSEGDTKKLRFIEDINFNHVKVGFCFDNDGFSSEEKQDGTCAEGFWAEKDTVVSDEAVFSTDYTDGSYIVALPKERTNILSCIRVKKQYSTNWIETSL